MTYRWLLAAGAALSLALLTLPAIPRFSVQSDSSEGSVVSASTSCDADARPAPMDFTIPDMDGNEVNLAELKGKVILLNFWATWCGPCKIEIPGFVELQEEYGDQGFQVLGFSVDATREQIRPFAEEFSVNYPMLIGLDHEEVQEAYGPIWGLPVSVWIDRTGTICKTHLGIASKDDFEDDLKEML